MTQQNKIQLFEQKKVRTVWDEEQAKWFFSIVDVVEVLTESVNPADYIYIRSFDDGAALYRGLAGFLSYCNERRAHQILGRGVTLKYTPKSGFWCFLLKRH